jgi:hypothetical protein
MFRLFLFMISVMAVGACAAEDVSPCPADAVPIQIMAPGYGSEIRRSAAEISDDIPHFHIFVATVTEHINSRLTKDKLCVYGARDMENMRSAEREKHSLFQFVYWSVSIYDEYIVPVMPPTGGPASCQIYSPWIDLVVDRGAVPQIRAIVRWNERQLLADQAVLAGAKNVPPGMAMPLTSGEYGGFVSVYQDSFTFNRPGLKPRPIEERVPPDLLWMLRRSWQTTIFVGSEKTAMRGAIEKGAEGYTKLVLALIDRCFVPSAPGRVDIHYSSIVDAADPVLLEQYKITGRLY